MKKIVPENHWLRTMPIAHRGLHTILDGSPENSLAAFENACRKKFPIELDVRITLDGKAVVFHDKNIFRITGKNIEINKLKIQDLIKFHLNGTRENIPTLEKVLDVVKGRVPLLIEIKNFSFSAMPEDIVHKAVKNYKGDVAFVTFNPLTLRRMQMKYPKYFCGLNVGRLENLLLKATFLSRIFYSFSKPHFLSYHISSDIQIPFRTRHRNFDTVFLAWTVKSKKEEEKARKFADNIIFENYLPK